MVRPCLEKPPMIRRSLLRNTPLTRTTVAFLHDVAMAAVSVPLALHLRVGGELFRYTEYFLLPATAIFTAVAAVVFWWTGLYRGMWRYASMNDLLAITRAVTLTILIFLPIMFLVSRLDGMPRSALIINWFVLMTLLGAPRFAYRVMKDGGPIHLLERGDPLRATALLIGAEDAAELFTREMARSRHAPYRVIGIVAVGGERAARRVGQRIHGVPVRGTLDDLPDIIKRLAAREMAPQRLIVTRDDFDREQMTRLLEIAEAHGMTLARLPRLDELESDQAPAGRVRPLAPADLLGRPQTVLDRAAMARLIEGRRVLITGAGGSIGAELARQVAGFAPAHLTLLDHAEFLLYQIDQEMAAAAPGLTRRAVLADVRDSGRLAQVLAEERPELVFHAAALKHVPMAEAAPTESVLTNVIGTRNVAEAARAAGARAMVLISTDKAVNPTSVLGASKRLAEACCQALDLAGAQAGGGQAGSHTRLITVRFGNVLGSTGSVVPLFQAQLAAGGPLTVTDPAVTRYFMTVAEAVELVLEASAFGAGAAATPAADPGRGKVFVLDMGRPVKILDLARQIIRLSGRRPDKDVKIVFTGLRQGEKLHEELSHQGEGLTPTAMPGVLVAGPRTADWPILESALAELEQTARSGRRDATIALLARLVPEYQVPAHQAPGDETPAPPPGGRAAAAPL
jgi:O-antigen biosynthesis protein WbqV